MSRIQTSDHVTKVWAVYPLWSLMAHANGDWCYNLGNFPSEHGLVEAYVDNTMSRLEFIWCGRIWSRYWKRPWGKRTLARLARQFAEDVVSGG